MSGRSHTFAILITSATAAAAFGVARFIFRRRENSLHEVDSNEKTNGNLLYIPMESNDVLLTAIYHQALHYLKQAHSTNIHVHEHGLSHLAKLNNLPPIYYSILGQHLDYYSAIRLARTYEANSNWFPTGVPFMFSIDNEADNKKNASHDNVFLHIIKQFFNDLIDEKKRPVDFLSRHYLKLLKSHMDDIDSRTIFDLVQHFEAEHADTSAKAIRRYRSTLELYSLFLYVVRGYADYYPLDVVRLNGLQILKYLYEKQQDNIALVLFLGKILLLLSRDEQTHAAFYAVGWVRILHDMALDKNNIVFSLLASTILANLDRPPRKSTSAKEEKHVQNNDVTAFEALPIVDSDRRSQAEKNIEDKKFDKTLSKQSVREKLNIFDKLRRRMGYTTPSSNNHENTLHNNTPKAIASSDKINFVDKLINRIKQQKLRRIPSWINDEVYGDKVILYSPAMYNIQQMDPDARWHQEPMLDIVFFHGVAGSAFKTWRQDSPHTEVKEQPTLSKLPLRNDKEETDELVGIGEETYWTSSKYDKSNNPVLKFDENQPSFCWPRDWLSKDIGTSHVRMLAVDYESAVSEWQVRSLPTSFIRRSMQDRAKEIGEQLKQAGIGKRPVIWVAHSMGGLLAKYILTDDENEDMRTNTRACIFFSVPHFGAELALLGIRHAFFLRPTVEIEELQPNSKSLLKLHENFLRVLKTYDNIKLLSFAENEKTTFSLRYQTVVVPSTSSQINIGKFFILNKNHIYICKPKSRDTLEYQELLDLVKTIYFQLRNELKCERENITEDILNSIHIFSSPIENDLP